MNTKIQIREATEFDINPLLYLEEVCFPVDRFTEDQIEYFLNRSRATVFVLVKDSKIIGAAYLLWRKSRFTARLYNLAVNPKEESKGYGRQLMSMCENEAAHRACVKMSLEVRQDNYRGIEFFKKLGFTVKSSLSDYYKDGMDGYRMSKPLKLSIPLNLKIPVPYYAQTLDFTCGSACLMMALKYFNPQTELTRTMETRIWKEATLIFMMSGHAGTDPYGLALSAVNRGLSCRVIISLPTTPMLKSVRKPKKQEIMKIVHNDMKQQAKKLGVSRGIYHYSIDDIISALYRGLIPIVMISTYRLTGDQVPHWVVVTGFDKNNIYIHDPDIASYKKDKFKARHLKIDKEEFIKMSRYGKEVYRCLLIIGPGN